MIIIIIIVVIIIIIIIIKDYGTQRLWNTSVEIVPIVVGALLIVVIAIISPQAEYHWH